MYEEKPSGSKWVIVLVVVAVAGLLGLCCCGGGAWWLYSAAKAPSNITYTLTSPAQAQVGQTVTLVVEITNTGSDAQELVNIDLYDDYLDGFAVVGSDPPYTASSNVFNMTTLEYGLDIAAGAAQTIEIELRAAQPGIWRGDVDVTIDSFLSFSTHLAQTEVLPASDPEAGTSPDDEPAE